MAIVTGDLYKGFTFGDISSKAYGVYITQEAAYDAPERDTEVVEIAGRNGAYILDKGRYKNITVSYKCGIALDDEQSFESAIRTFRNALASKAGKYVRLEDEYNTNEYRQAAFLGGIEVDMSDRRAGEFTVEFDCMPQRFLKSGETAVSVASGGTITNPTLFESHPLLQVWGYGNINLNDETIIIDNIQIGDVLLANGYTYSEEQGSMSLRASQLLTGDQFNISKLTESITLKSRSGLTCKSITFSSVSGMTPTLEYKNNALGGMISVAFPVPAYAYGTSRTDSAVWSATATYSDNSTRTVEMRLEIEYNGDSRISYHAAFESGGEHSQSRLVGIGEVRGYSTMFALGEPLYFDLDIGEAYKIEDGAVVSINNAVTIPAKLPVLVSGANTITYENTVDQLKIVPRWWEV